MVTKRKYLFLFLTLICLFGLVAIFIVDGYMGIYDTTYITTGELEQRIEADTRFRSDIYWSTGIKWGEKAFFRYELANRQFSNYMADINVSIWQNQEKVLDVVSQPISIAPFDEAQIEWTIDTAILLPDSAPSEQSYEYTVIIKRGELERRGIIHINPSYEPKPIPVPTR